MGEYVKPNRVIFSTIFLIVVLFALDSCVNSQKLVYFNGSTKSFKTATNLTVEAPIQKNDLLKC